MSSLQRDAALPVVAVTSPGHLENRVLTASTGFRPAGCAGRKGWLKMLRSGRLNTRDSWRAWRSPIGDGAEVLGGTPVQQMPAVSLVPLRRQRPIA